VFVPLPAFGGNPDDGSDGLGVMTEGTGDAPPAPIPVSLGALVGCAFGFFAGSSPPEHEYARIMMTATIAPATIARRRQYTLGDNGPTVSLMMFSR